MKTIVTHISPDLDAISSVWLIKRFLPEWNNATVEFVPAGETLESKPADADSQVLHVDTGMGKFDHHQTDADTCAAKLVFQYLNEQNYLKPNYVEALERLTDVVNDFDHFKEVFLPDADSDVFDFLLVSLIEGSKAQASSDTEILGLGEKLCDALLQVFFNKTNAEAEIKKGRVFQSKWGKALAIETENEEASRLAQKQGHVLVIRKSPKKGHLRIKALPLPEINLRPVYDLLKAKDPQATWFFHASGHMVLNGSSKNPKSVPTSLSLSEAVKLINPLIS